MSDKASISVKKLTGWGRTAATYSMTQRVDEDQIASALLSANERGVLARGMGRSYGDAAQNGGGLVLSLLDHKPQLLDDRSGVRVSAATSLHDLMGYLLANERFVAVTPGTRYVSVGGAIACDIHGKNHHVVGSFGDHVRSFDLVDGTGTLRTITKADDPEAFNATVGGMGLTGVITSAVLDVIPVESAWMRVDTSRVPDVEQVMARILETDSTTTYSVAWIDTLARGTALGRSVLTIGEHARVGELTTKAASNRWLPPGGPLINAPQWLPRGLVSLPTITAFNEVWYRKAPVHRQNEIQSISAFFHPLDGVGGWNRMYGSTGMVQYQFVVPDGAEDALVRALEMIAGARNPSFLAVIKRFGPGNEGYLSFPMEGWTLALDMPAQSSLIPLFAALDDLIVSVGGRLYLAKDSRATQATMTSMYPQIEAFKAAKARLDPQGLFQSDLARRLGLGDFS